MIASPEEKEKRRKALKRKKLDKDKKRNPIAQDLHTSKYRLRIIENEKNIKKINIRDVEIEDRDEGREHSERL